MAAVLVYALTPAEQDRLIELTVQRERGRLLAFIRRRIADAAEAEDILQETLYELVSAYRLMQPVEQAGAWLVRVARNRIIDRLRRTRRRRAAVDTTDAADTGGGLADLLPSAAGDPHEAALRELLLAEIGAALRELPPEQREVFVAHELEGLSFRELSARSGTSLNTLLSRKRYATRFLRERLQAVWDDWLMT
ncbi:MAG TPA: sigma-70 family RNA polymerase sigma factor [Steroidobacteraceae bacterium]|nr:sigma-70 family RNA polymerase sigma factor [Steroidobacteraceae bacterium]